MFWHCAESRKTWEQLEQLKQGMGSGKLERTTPLRVGYIYIYIFYILGYLL